MKYFNKLNYVFGIVIVLIFVSSIFNHIIASFPYQYKDNTWGVVYFTIQNSVPIYLTNDTSNSIYTLVKNEFVMCDSKYENEYTYMENDRLFCWYIFEKDREPISGWINVKNISKYEVKR